MIDEEHHGWSPGVGSGPSDAEKARRKAMDSPPTEEGAGREISEAEENGVASAETEPGSPAGAGESISRRPEQRAGTGGTAGHKGRSRRPYGRTDDEDTGVGKGGKATDDSPDLPSGDQGG
jgi:hypothetical protein